MIRTVMVMTALALSAPVMAQQAASPEQNAIAQPAKAADAVASIVDAEFPAYDANKDGQLDQLEFARWMTALKEQELKATGKNLAPEQITDWANGAFTTADADKSVSISKPELITYLSNGAG